MKHKVKYEDIKDQVREIELFTEAGRDANKSLIMVVNIPSRHVSFRVENHSTGHNGKFNSIENAISNYNEQ